MLEGAKCVEKDEERDIRIETNTVGSLGKKAAPWDSFPGLEANGMQLQESQSSLKEGRFLTVGRGIGGKASPCPGQEFHS